jgi:hypothetical protein
MNHTGDWSDMRKTADLWRRRYDEASRNARQFAEEIEQLRIAYAELEAKKDAEIERLREAVVWYGEQARLARLIHSEGDAGRNALAADGGQRARAALAAKEESRE